MTLRLPFSWQNTRFSMYCWKTAMLASVLCTGGRWAENQSRIIYLLQLGLGLRHLEWCVLGSNCPTVTASRARCGTLRYKQWESAGPGRMMFPQAPKNRGAASDASGVSSFRLLADFIAGDSVRTRRLLGFFHSL